MDHGGVAVLADGATLDGAQEIPAVQALRGALFAEILYAGDFLKTP